MKPRARTIVHHSLLSELAVDDEFVYATGFSAEKEPRLVMAKHDGSEFRSVPTVGEAVGKIVSDAEQLYVLSGQAVAAISKTTGVVNVLARMPVEGWGITLDGTHVYVSIRGQYPAYADGGVMRVAKAGGALEWMIRGGPVAAIGVHDDAIYYSQENQLRCRHSDGETTTLAAVHTPHAIAFARGRVIWSEYDSHGALSSIAIDGSDPRNRSRQFAELRRLQLADRLARPRR